MFHAFADQVANSLTAASKTDISVCFHLHVTSKEMRRSSTDSFDVPEGVKVVASRPQIQLTLEALIERAADEGVEGGVVVGVCGPSGLVVQTRQAVMAVDADRVGGVVLHSESFAW